MRVGLLTQWYDPEPGPAALPGVLARGLVERGHDVSVVTGFPNYPTGRIADGYAVRRRQEEHVDGVQVTRVALYPNHGSSVLGRAVNYGSFGLSSLVNGLGSLRNVDALWVNYSPITVAGTQLAAKAIYGVPSVVHVLDLWPDTLMAAGFVTGGRLAPVVGRGLSAWCDLMYRAASSVAYISPGVGAVLQERGVATDKLHYVPMWADEEIFRPSSTDMRAEFGIPADAVVLLYAGAMGEAQGLISLIEACERIEDPRFVCLIAGSGVTESALRHRATHSSNVRFLGRVPQQRMTDLMATADISYVGLRTHALSNITMPSKTQAALASGTPLIVAATGDVAEMVRASGTGFTAAPADSEAIAGAIRQALALGRRALAKMGAHARDYYVTTFGVAAGVSRVEQLLEQAACAPPRRGPILTGSRRTSMPTVAGASE